VALKVLFKSFIDYVKRHSVLVRFGVVIVIFTILLHNIQPQNIIEAFKHARPSYLFLSLSFLIPNILIQVLKWDYILRTLSPKPSFKSAFVSLLGGFFLGAASPGRTGEFMRGFLIPEHSPVKTASLTIVDKGFNMITITVAGLFSLGLLLPWPLSILPIMGELIVIIALLNIHRLEPFLARLLHKFTNSEQVDNALTAFDALSRKNVLVMTGFSIAFYLVFATQFYLMILCFVDLPLSVAVKTLPVVYLIQLALPISIGEFGIKEMAAVKLLVPFGIALESVFSASLTNNVIVFLLPSLTGGIILAFYRSRPDLKVRSSTDHTVQR
jgi:uncharacterized protein (TIRG00374 family)